MITNILFFAICLIVIFVVGYYAGVYKYRRIILDIVDSLKPTDKISIRVIRTLLESGKL